MHELEACVRVSSRWSQTKQRQLQQHPLRLNGETASGELGDLLGKQRLTSGGERSDHHCGNFRGSTTQ